MKKGGCRSGWSLFNFLLLLVGSASGGKIKGVIKGSDSWVFIDKFCFYPTKEEEDYGVMLATFTYPADTYQQLLLYWLGENLPGEVDDEFGSWQRVYESDRSCEERVKEAARKNNVHPFDALKKETDKPVVRETSGADDFEKDGRMYKKRFIQRKMDTVRPRWFFVAVAACLPDCGSCSGSVNSVCHEEAEDLDRFTCENTYDKDSEGNCLSTNTSWTGKFKDSCSKCRWEEGRFCAAGVDVTYDIEFFNGDGIEMYLGADERGIVYTYIVFFMLYVGLTGYMTYVKMQLMRRRKYHHTVRLLNFAVWAKLTSTTAWLVYWAHYGSEGDKLLGFKVIGSVFDGFGEFATLLQVILVSKGWTIVRRKISAQGRTKIAAYMSLYIGVYWACHIYYEYGLDPAMIVYIFDTAPGYVLISLRIVAFGWICYAVHTTLAKYKAKKGFYRKYRLLASFWMLSLPMIVLINSQIDIWFRAKIAVGLMCSVNFFMLAILVAMYNPNSPCNQSFPFHATTTAMLQQRAAKGAGHNNGGGGGGGGFRESHLRRAADISRRIRQGVSLLQAYASDLSTFLEELDPSEGQEASLPMLERGFGSGENSGANTLPSDAVFSRSKDQISSNGAMNSWSQQPENQQDHKVDPSMSTLSSPIASTENEVRQRKGGVEGLSSQTAESPGDLSEDVSPFGRVSNT